jgi:hypothetical protein
MLANQRSVLVSNFILHIKFFHPVLVLFVGNHNWRKSDLCPLIFHCLVIINAYSNHNVVSMC